MFTEKAKLLRHPKPFTDESIAGYFLRLAEANCYESVHWLLQLFKLRQNGDKHPYIYGMADLKTAAVMSSVREIVLKELAYKPINFSSHTLIGNYEAFGQIIPIFLIRSKEPKVCPKCLIENPYCRKVWELAAVTACPIHKCLLIETCPACNKKIDWNRHKVCECSCGFDLSATKVFYVSENEIRLVNRIFQLFNLSKKKPVNFPEHLQRFNLTELLSLLFLVMGQNRGRSDSVGKSLSKQLSNIELHNEFNNALNVYENFPNNFFGFLDSLKKVYFEKVQQNSKTKHLTTTRQIIFGGTIRALASSSSDRNFDLIRDAFDEYYSREKLQSFGLNLDYKEISAAEFLNSHLTLNETKKLLKITKVAVKSIINAGTLKAIEAKTINGKEFWFVEKKSAEHVKEVLEDCISAPNIITELGIQTTHLNSLIDRKILNEVTGLYVSTTFSRVFSRKELNKISQIFEKAFIREEKPNSGKFVNSTKTAVLLGRIGIDFGMFVRLVAAGKITPVGKSKKKGVLGFYYDESEINSIYNEALTKIKKGTLSLTEVEKKFNIERDLIRKLIQKNLLKQVEVENAQFLKVRIDPKSVINFKKLYVLSTELARKHRTLPQVINKLLGELNVNPIENSSAVHCFVYCRNEIENITLDKRNIKRAVTPLFSTAETAEILKINAEAVIELVSNGTLKPYVRSRNLRSNELFFTETGIENYRKLQLPEFNAVSRKSAAQLLNIGITAFKDRYVKTKKVLPIKLENKTRRIYYSRADIEKLREMELNGIRSSEAAEILGVNISCVNKLTIAEELLPISGPKVDGFQYNVYLRTDVEALLQKRRAFKEEQIKSGKSARFGKVSGNRYSKTQRVKSL